jgi:hypothetical protein
MKNTNLKVYFRIVYLKDFALKSTVDSKNKNAYDESNWRNINIIKVLLGKFTFISIF